jgi:hypothetical protein
VAATVQLLTKLSKQSKIRCPLQRFVLDLFFYCFEVWCASSVASGFGVQLWKLPTTINEILLP